MSRLLQKNEVKIQLVMTKYKHTHTHTPFAKALNKILEKQLFKVQVSQEVNNPERVSSIWVKHPYGLVEHLNDTKTQITGMKPKETIELRKVPLLENYPPEDTLPEDGLYWCFLQPGDEHDDQCKRATNKIWSKKTCRLREIVEDFGNWVMYYLSDGPQKALVSEELALIPEDTELSPGYIEKW